jgi:DNA-binding NarL/FixJ family response regulator
MKIIIVDDNEQFRLSLKDFIENKLKHEVIGEATNGINFLKLSNLLNADIILMDVFMEKMDGLTAAGKILDQFYRLKIIALTMYKENISLLKLLEIGFKGCVFKSDIYSSLEIALQNVYNGEQYFPNKIRLN